MAELKFQPARGQPLLWRKETPIKRDAVETYGLAHADDISALIMAWVWAKERREPFDPQAGGYNNDKTTMD